MPHPAVFFRTDIPGSHYDERAAAWNAERLVLARQIGAEHAIAIVLNQPAEVAPARGDLPSAKTLLQEALPLWPKFNEQRGIIL